MTMTAFVLAKISPDVGMDILDEIRENELVEEAYLIYGAFDLIVKVLVKNPEDLDDFIFNKLRKVSGVLDTATCICASC
ncbi:MAG: Lrp/AsnC ligand binding domain-containing protein [Promethearchaeota archaeon]